MKDNYLFTSERLGFRNWKNEDVKNLYEMNSDDNVMKYFPKTLTDEENRDLYAKLKSQYLHFGHTYFATEILKTKEFIGFIGLAYQDYKSEFTPAIDIGWRLKKSMWGKGYATEGAKACLDFGFGKLNLNEIIATCTLKNTRSENVMKKIGMKKVKEFMHPIGKKCLCYRIMKSDLELN